MFAILAYGIHPSQIRLVRSETSARGANPSDWVIRHNHIDLSAAGRKRISRAGVAP